MQPTKSTFTYCNSSNNHAEEIEAVIQYLSRGVKINQKPRAYTEQTIRQYFKEATQKIALLESERLTKNDLTEEGWKVLAAHYHAYRRVPCTTTNQARLQIMALSSIFREVLSLEEPQDALLINIIEKLHLEITLDNAMELLDLAKRYQMDLLTKEIFLSLDSDLNKLIGLEAHKACLPLLHYALESGSEELGWICLVHFHKNRDAFREIHLEFENLSKTEEFYHELLMASQPFSYQSDEDFLKKYYPLDFVHFDSTVGRIAFSYPIANVRFLEIFKECFPKICYHLTVKGMDEHLGNYPPLMSVEAYTHIFKLFKNATAVEVFLEKTATPIVRLPYATEVHLKHDDEIREIYAPQAKKIIVADAWNLKKLVAPLAVSVRLDKGFFPSLEILDIPSAINIHFQGLRCFSHMQLDKVESIFIDDCKTLKQLIAPAANSVAISRCPELAVLTLPNVLKFKMSGNKAITELTLTSAKQVHISDCSLVSVNLPQGKNIHLERLPLLNLFAEKVKFLTLRVCSQFKQSLELLNAEEVALESCETSYLNAPNANIVAITACKELATVNIPKAISVYCEGPNKIEELNVPLVQEIELVACDILRLNVPKEAYIKR